MSIELSTVVQEVVIDDSKTTQSASRVVDQMEKMAAAAEKVDAANQQTAKGLALFDEALKRSEPAQESALRRLNSWKVQADPVEGALQRLSRAEQDLNRAVRQGLTTEQEKARILDQLWTKLLSAAEAQEKYNKAVREQDAQNSFNAQLGVRDDFNASQRANDIEAYGQAIEAQARSYERLAERIDPAAAAARRFREEQQIIETSVRTGVVTQEEGARTLAAIRQEYISASHSAERFAESNDAVTSSTGRLDGAMSTLKKTAAAFGIAFSAAAMLSVFNDTEDRVISNERAVARLNAQLAVTGGAVGKSLSDIQNLARQIEADTGVAQKVIIDRAAALTTFTTIADEQFDRTLRIGLDMAEVYGQDLKSALEAVGRAVENPLKGMGMLERQGFRLEASQKEQIKTLIEAKKQYEAQEIVLRMLEDLVGGTAVRAYQSAEKAQDEAARAGQNLLDQWYAQSGAAAASTAAWRSAGETFEWLAQNTTALADAAKFAGIALGGLMVARGVGAAIAALPAIMTSAYTSIYAFAVANGAYTASAVAATAATRAFHASIAALGGPVGAILAVAGVGAAAWLTYGRALDTSSEAIERNRRVMEELTGVVQGHGFSTLDEAKFALRRAEASEALTKSLVREAEAELALAEARNTARGGASGPLGVSGADVSAEAAAARIAALRERLNELGGEADANGAVIAALREEVDRLVIASGSASRTVGDLTDEQLKLHKAFRQDIQSIENNTRSLLEQAAAYSLGEKAVIEARIAGEVRQAKLKNQMVDEKAMTKVLLDEAAAMQHNAAMQQLRNEKVATDIAQARARAAMISDPSARHAAELALERQAHLNKLTREYSLELERIPELMAEFDQQKAYEEHARFWNDVRALSERMSGDISDFLVDGFVNAGEGGKSMFHNLWDGALAGAKRFLANLAAEFLKQRLILPIVTAFVGGNSGIMGIVQPGGAGGALGSMGSIGGLGSMGSLAGDAWRWVSGLFGAGTVSPAASQASMLAAYTGPANSFATGGAGGGLSAALGAVPVWGWIATAAAMVKSFTEGADPRSAKGALDTLLLPSIEQWQTNPGRSLYNAFNPIGTVARDFGAPAWVGDMFGIDPLGGLLTAAGLPAWLTPGGLMSSLFGEKQPSNKFAMRTISTADWKIGDPVFNADERSQKTIDATTQMADVFVQAAQAILALTGGTAPGGAFVVAGERDGFQVGIGQEGINFFNAGSLGKMGSFTDPEKAMEWMITEFAKSITGVEDENFRKALAFGGGSETLISNLQLVHRINELTNDGSMVLVNALKAINVQFDEMVTQATTLGIATDQLEVARRREIDATRGQFEATIMGLQTQANSAATQFFAQTLDPLTQFRDNVLRQGQLSNMSSRDQFLYTQSLFRGIDDATSATDIVSLGQSYLTQARAYGASGGSFTDAFREVNDVIGRLIETRENEKRGFEALGVIFQTSNADQTAALKESIGELIDEVRKLRKAQERAA